MPLHHPDWSFCFECIFFLIPFMRVNLRRYFSRYDPLGKQETRKIFFINKYQLCRGLNTDFAFTSSDLSLHCVKQRWAATHGIFWLLGRPMRPLKYSLPYPLREAWYWLRLPMHFTRYGNVGGSSLSNRRFWGKGERWKRKRERAEGKKRLTQMLLV